ADEVVRTAGTATIARDRREFATHDALNRGFVMAKAGAGRLLRNLHFAYFTGREIEGFESGFDTRQGLSGGSLVQGIDVLGRFTLRRLARPEALQDYLVAALDDAVGSDGNNSVREWNFPARLDLAAARWAPGLSNRATNHDLSDAPILWLV